MTSDFYDEQEEHSAVKTAIVVKYFRPWSTIMLKQRTGNIAYLDFYSGPGRFEDGSKSTPLLLLEESLKSPALRDRLVAKFNDIKAEYTVKLQAEIDALPGIDGMRHKPVVTEHKVEDHYLAQFQVSSVPTLSFIDPWGYKGLTLNLLQSVIQGFGSEVIFFFNYSRINAAIDNGLVEPHVQGIFGEARLARLRHQLRTLTVAGRESLVMRELGATFEELGAQYLIPFRFVRESGRTHYICFVSKHRLGYSIMKDVMAGLGIKDLDGVPKFEYMPTPSIRHSASQPRFVFDIDRPILQLGEALLERFAGRRLPVKRIYEEHNVGTPFVLPNYKRVLLEMERAGRISCTPPSLARQQGTMGDKVLVTFPG